MPDTTSEDDHTKKLVKTKDSRALQSLLSKGPEHDRPQSHELDSNRNSRTIQDLFDDPAMSTLGPKVPASAQRKKSAHVQLFRHLDNRKIGSPVRKMASYEQTESLKRQENILSSRGVRVVLSGDAGVSNDGDVINLSSGTGGAAQDEDGWEDVDQDVSGDQSRPNPQLCRFPEVREILKEMRKNLAKSFPADHAARYTAREDPSSDLELEPWVLVSSEDGGAEWEEIEGLYHEYCRHDCETVTERTKKRVTDSDDSLPDLEE